MNRKLGSQCVVFVAFAGLMLLSGCTKMTRVSTMPTPSAAPGADTARVYFIMPVRFPAGNVYIMQKDKLIGFLTNRQWFYVDVPAGEHMFMTVSENTTILDGTLAGGKTYYVKAFVTPGIGSTRVYTALVTQGTEDWDAKQEWIDACEHMELVPESAAKWEAKYKDRNADRIAKYEAGELEAIQFSDVNAE